MKISRGGFIEIKSDKQVNRQIITINENGKIELAREMWDVVPGDVFSLQIRSDSRQLLLDPEGSGLMTRRHEPIIAKNLLDMIEEKVAVFPMHYKMKWEPSERVWIGDLQTPPSVLTRRRAQLLKEK